MQSREFKETEIGKIPKEWEAVRLSDIFEVITGTTPSTKNPDYWSKATVNWFTPADMTDITGQAYLTESRRKITKKGVEDTTLTIMPPGSIIISTRAPVGYVGILTCDSAFNQGCKGLMPKQGKKISPEFYYYYLSFIQTKLQNMSGGSTFKELGKDILERCPIIYLDFAEQSKISFILSTLDEAIQKSDQIIEKTERLKKGLMHKLLTQGIGHTEFKDTEIGKIPKGWEMLTLDNLAEIRRGASPRPINDPSYFSDLGVGWIRISDVTSVYKYLKKTTQYLSKKGESRSVRVRPGDLIMSICATIGKPIILDMDACIHDGFVLFANLSKKVDTSFLFYFLQNHEQIFTSQKQVGTQGNLNTSLVGRTTIFLPSFQEQQKIAEILGTVDEKLEKERGRKEKLERIKKALMNDLLTGKKRVK